MITSFPGTERGDQLLSGPLIPNSKGKSICKAIVATQLEWEILDGNVIGTCWDTTRSNSGARIGAAKLYDVSRSKSHLFINKEKKSNLWLACRRKYFVKWCRIQALCEIQQKYSEVCS